MDHKLTSTDTLGMGRYVGASITANKGDFIEWLRERRALGPATITVEDVAGFTHGYMIDVGLLLEWVTPQQGMTPPARGDELGQKDKAERECIVDRANKIALFYQTLEAGGMKPRDAAAIVRDVIGMNKL